VSRLVPQDEWRVTIADHHQGYIDWVRFLAYSASIWMRAARQSG
jgi:hypothetical protein